MRRQHSVNSCSPTYITLRRKTGLDVVQVIFSAVEWQLICFYRPGLPLTDLPSNNQHRDHSARQMTKPWSSSEKNQTSYPYEEYQTEEQANCANHASWKNCPDIALRVDRRGTNLTLYDSGNSTSLRESRTLGSQRALLAPRISKI